MPNPPYTSTPEAELVTLILASNLKRAMGERGYDTLSLSVASDVPLRTVQEILRAGSVASIVAIARLAATLNTTVDALLMDDNARTDAFMPLPPAPYGATIKCIHSHIHMKDDKGNSLGVCGNCLTGWERVQARKRALYEACRDKHRAEWNEENERTRAEQTAGMSPKEVDDVKR